MFNHHDPQLKPWQRTEIRHVPQDLKEKLFTRDYPTHKFKLKFHGRPPWKLESKYVICPIPDCEKLYQNWNGLRSVEQIERSFKSHLTGKHCLKGEAFKRTYREAERIGYALAKEDQF